MTPSLVLAALLAVPTPATAGEPFGGPSPWPEIRRERIRTLLPQAMERADVDAWVVVCRENDNDPLAAHVGCENASGTAIFLFFRETAGARSLALSPAGEAVALRDVGVVDDVAAFDRGADVYALAAERLKARNPGRIAVNMGDSFVADGISHTQMLALQKALGTELASRLVSSEDLVLEWLSVKLPQEVEILRRAAALTAQLELEAYAAIVPGTTRDADVAAFLKKRMRELGVADGWAPDQNPNVNSGVDRGHSHATDRVIQGGDVIQTDFGIKVHGTWVTDIQRFAYVLRPGETKPPADIQKAWENGRRGSRIALAAMKPGVRGYDVDAAQRAWMKEAGSEFVPWSTGHPVGYWAHDPGPSLGGAQRATPPRGASLRVLRPGQTFAFDGFYAWKLPEPAGATKTISVEEMAVVTATGAEYLVPPQEELVLVGGAPRAAQAADVVFVCEHGSVKSVIAAEWFNRRAAESGLALRAVSRGIAPDARVPAPIAGLLAEDGFDVAAFVPARLDASSAAVARRVVTMGLDAVETFGVARERWDDVPPASKDYAAARDAIRRRVDVLLRELAGR